MRHMSSEGLRDDILTLLRFWEGIESSNPIDLFWGMFESQGPIVSKPLSRLPEPIEEGVLDVLERLYNRHRVPYSVDADDSDIREFILDSRDSGSLPDDLSEHLPVPEKLKDMVAYLHVAAARAFRIMKSQDEALSEEALSCLNEVERTMQRLSLAGFGEPFYAWNDRCLEFGLSSLAVSAKVLVELSRVRRDEGRYDEALHYLARATERYDKATFVSGQEGVDILFRYLEQGLGNISPQEMALTFLSLKRNGQTDNWRQVTQDCNSLRDGLYVFGRSYARGYSGDESYEYDLEIEEVVKGEDGNGIVWQEFWAIARTWASAQLSSNEYRALREEDKKGESEERLKNYFFGRDWTELPEGARRRLTSVDVSWNSTEELGIEGVLNDLRRAIEEMCYESIWQPLEGSSGGQELLEFVALKTDLQEKQEAPGIRDFIRVCELECWCNFLEQHRLNKDEIRFLTKELPAKMRQLQERRNPAEHDVGRLWQRDEVRPYFQAFLGIGQRGVLPELARIAGKWRLARRKVKP